MEILPAQFWHLADPYSLIFHNVPLSKGYMPSTSVIAVGELEGATTLYAALNVEQRKESVFEQVRSKSHPRLPSRSKAFFCFSSREDAQRARIEWFNGARKEMVRLHLTTSALVHSADSRLLNAQEDDWADHAELYWAGGTTSDPLMETIVHGHVFFPDWQTKPFGSLF